MTNQEATDELQYAIDLIKQDGKDWLDERDIPVLEMAISALQAQELSNNSPKLDIGNGELATNLQQTCNDTISRQDAIEAVASMLRRKFGIGGDLAEITLAGLPSAQPEPSEITDEQAILHLQSTGWMQNHDREMYESGLRERLADDSGSYDSLIPCEDTISRQEAIDVCNKAIDLWRGQLGEGIVIAVKKKIEELPSAQPESHWIPVSERLPEEKEFVLVTFGWLGRKTDPAVNIDEIRDGDWMISEVVTAWMPLPEPYRAERRTDDL